MCYNSQKSIDNITDGEPMAQESISSFLDSRYSEVSPFSFYRDLFPKGELDKRGAMTEGKYCGIAVQVCGFGRNAKAKRYTICDDLSPISELLESDEFLVISPVSYAGKTQKQSMARNLYAIVFDLDGLVVKDGHQSGLEDLIYQATNELLPFPTYIVSSGTGVHLYYVLERPIPLFKNVLEQLRELRADLTKRIWNTFTTTLWEHPQMESVTQGFRAVGSSTKNGQERVRAFLTGDKVTVEYLNGFVADSARVTRFAYKSDMTVEEARKKYPKWYESRIQNGQPSGTWTVKRDLYDWWKRQIFDGATVGHRYFCIMCLAVYARKCGIDRDELTDDALSMIPFLDKQTIQEDNHFDVGDVMKALEAYEASYITFPRRSIEELTAIDIPANKRNYRKQRDHLKIARAMQHVYKELGEQEKCAGRPSKRELVEEFVRNNPGMSVNQVSQELGISWATASKYMKVDL